MKSLLEIRVRDLLITIEKEIRQGIKEGKDVVQIKGFYSNKKIVGESVLKELTEAGYEFERGNQLTYNDRSNLYIAIEL